MAMRSVDINGRALYAERQGKRRGRLDHARLFEEG